jgi:hypothetical protein
VLDHVTRRSWGGESNLVEMSPANQRRSGYSVR